MSDMPERKNRLTGILYYIAVVLMPSILLFRLYNRNHADNDLVFYHILIVAAVFAVVSVLLFLLLQWLLKNRQAAFLIITVLWLSFWLFEPIFRRISRIGGLFTRRSVLMGITAVGFIAVVFFIKKFKNKLDPKFDKIRPAFDSLTFAVIVLFLFNLYPGINHQFVLARARANPEIRAAEIYIKRDFHVDPDLPKPDIYWLHMDGMMNLETLESFWGEDQQYLRDELAARGFYIYPGAELNAGFTNSALPALLSPYFYDNFLGELLADIEDKLRVPRANAFVEGLAQVGVTFLDDIVGSYELFAALTLVGYDIEINDNLSGRLPLRFDEFIYPRRHFPDGDLARLLTLTTPFYFAPTPAPSRAPLEEQNLEPIARFIWYSHKYTHMFDNPFTGGNTGYELYYLAFDYAAKQMLAHIDLILEENHDAVIILQSDHGFHNAPTQDHLVEQGYPHEQILDLIHSSFSAMRIPERYGGLDAPVYPKNIARELVNRFVGENYTLLR